MPPLIAGKTIQEVGDRFDGDQLGDDPRAAWDAAAGAAREALGQPGAVDRVVHLSHGDTPAADYVHDLAMDLAIHAWDLARGVGADESLDPDLVVAIDERWRPRLAGQAGTGSFAPAIDTNDDMSAQVRLLALFGRDAR